MDEKVLSNFFEHNCSDDEIRQIITWFDKCDDNKQEWLNLRIHKAKTNYEYFSERTELSYCELMRRCDQYKALEKSIARKIILKILKYAAIIVICLGTSFFSYNIYQKYTNPKLYAFETYSNQAVRNISLPDGSVATLSANSKISYTENFIKQREITVEGKIFIDVVNNKKPFTVLSPNCNVKVHGTSFEINDISGGSMCDVTLLTGMVEIFDNDQNHICMLKPGQKFELNNSSKKYSVTELNAGLYTSWRNKVFEFDGLPLYEVVKVLERHYGVRIIIDNKSVKGRKLVGSLSFEKDIYEMMKAISAVTGINYKIDSQTRVYITE